MGDGDALELAGVSGSNEVQKSRQNMPPQRAREAELVFAVVEGGSAHEHGLACAQYSKHRPNVLLVVECSLVLREP